MGALKNVAIAILSLSLLTFIALFGQLPALRKTPIGWLQRALCLHLPNGLRVIDRQATGGKITTKSQRLGHYLFYEGNPVVLIIYLFILTGSATLFLWKATSLLPTHLLLPIPVLLGLPYYFTYLSTSHKAHYITPATVSARLKDYPYDHVLFRPKTHCRTCNLPKPARSKHCSLCSHCISRCDHHCPWVANCLGRGNYRYFLALLLTLSILQMYGAYLSYYILRPYLVHRTLGARTWGQFGDAIVVAVNAGGLAIAGVGFLAASTAALPLGLLGYHCYLIWAGMTTNESQKWADWRDDMADGCVFKASRKALEARQKERRHANGDARHNGSTANPALNLGIGDEDDDGYVAWPVSSDQVIVRTNDGNPPQGQEGMWTRIWSLDQVDNIYDLGGWDNLMEVVRGR